MKLQKAIETSVIEGKLIGRLTGPKTHVSRHTRRSEIQTLERALSEVRVSTSFSPDEACLYTDTSVSFFFFRVFSFYLSAAFSFSPEGNRWFKMIRHRTPVIPRIIPRVVVRK